MADDTQKPRDPWRHVVLVAVFSFLFLEAGMLKSLGVMIPSFVKQFDSSYAVMGALTSLPWSIEYCSSIGQGMVVIPALHCLHRHYGVQFPFACSVAFVGSLVGILVMPIMTEFLLEAFSLKGALLIMGGLNLNMFPIGLVLKLPKKSPRQRSGTSSSHEIVHKSLLNDQRVICCDDGNSTSFKDESLHNRKDEEHLDRHSKKLHLYGNPDRQTNSVDVESCNDKFMIDDKSCIPHTRETTTDIRQFRCLKDRAGTTIQLAWMKELLVKLKLFFAFLLPCDALDSFVSISWMLFVVPYAVSVGIEESRAVYLATIGGIGGVVARILTSLVLRLRPTWSPYCYLTMASLVTVTLFLQPVSTSYGHLIGCSLLIGIGAYGSLGLCEPMLSLVVEPGFVSTAISIMYVGKGLSGIMTSFLSGT
ncbi:monocarboxylate transporter 12-like [Diadema antillarum]|uniref:monocarboxylate transporter 12-like n=1 Tax=Diadema antillarum TaxID=105358 RepID=UPI003A870DD5